MPERAIISVPGAPSIPGLAFRRFRGEADYPLMVVILDACNAADQLDYINTVDEIAWVFARLTNCAPWRDMLLAEVQSIRMFHDMGMQETALGVDIQNPSGALGLYESVGYR